MLTSEKTSSHRSQSKDQRKPILLRSKLRPLSIEELIQVDLATFREGRNHCRWPREVVEKFLAVQV